jgi:cob(I)alamin adenosyltransferase
MPGKDPVNDLSLMEATEQLEHRIDELSDDKKFHFVLPGGTLLSACLHLARSHTRTCERRLWTLNRSYPIDINILKYMNRLSDYFFALALCMK